MDSKIYIDDFRATRDRKNINKILDDGGVVACACEIGCLLLAAADNAEALQRLRNWHKAEGRRMLFRCVPDLRKAWPIWKEDAVKQDELSQFLSHIYLNLLIVGNLAEDKFPDDTNSKVYVWVGERGLVNGVLRSVNRPLAGVVVRISELRDEDRKLNTEAKLKILAQGADLIVGTRDEWAPQEESILDVSCSDWRIIKLGAYSFSELSGYTKRRFLLSGGTPKIGRHSSFSAASVVVYLGDAERISRRLHHICENLRNPREAAFFIDSSCLHNMLSEFKGAGENDRFREIYPLFEAERKTEANYFEQRNKFLIEKLREFRADEEVISIYVEFSEAVLAGEFAEYARRLAVQVISLNEAQEQASPGARQ